MEAFPAADMFGVIEDHEIRGTAASSLKPLSGELKAHVEWLSDEAMKAVFEHRNGAERTVMVFHSPAPGGWVLLNDIQTRPPVEVQGFIDARTGPFGEPRPSFHHIAKAQLDIEYRSTIDQRQAWTDLIEGA